MRGYYCLPSWSVLHQCYCETVLVSARKRVHVCVTPTASGAATQRNKQQKAPCKKQSTEDSASTGAATPHVHGCECVYNQRKANSQSTHGPANKPPQQCECASFTNSEGCSDAARKAQHEAPRKKQRSKATANIGAATHSSESGKQQGQS
jgi:hypothetical protein